MAKRDTLLIKREFLRKFQQNYCSVLKTCEDLGIDYARYYQWIKEDSTFRNKIEMIRDLFYDEIEATIIKHAIENPKLGLQVLERKRTEKWAHPKDVQGKKLERDEFIGIVPRELDYLDKETFDATLKAFLEGSLTQYSEKTEQNEDNAKDEI